MKTRLLFGFILGLICFVSVREFQSGTHTAAAADVVSGKVVKIADGDTITVLVEHQQVRVRLWGIDTPERRQPFGARARQFTGDLCFGQVVTLRVRDTDRYGRTVAEVILPDGRNLNHEIVRAGLAWWYQRYARHDAALQKLEAEARAAKRGLWSDQDPVAPWEWRKTAAKR